MKAKVVNPFKGVKDGEIYPRNWKPGDTVVGDLAHAAIAQGDAVPTDGRETKVISAAPETSSPLDGARIGEDEQPSSSPPAPQPAKPISSESVPRKKGKGRKSS